MSKTVLVKSPNGRNFRVNFSADCGKSDFASFKEAFYRICEKDVDLSAVIKHKEHLLSFQIFDSTFGCNIELTDFENISNGSIIELFIFTSVAMPIIENVESVTSLDFSISSDDDLRSSMSIDERSMEPTPDNTATKRVGKRLNSVGLTFPCALPKLSAAVKKDIEDGTIHQNFGRFVRECAAFLLTLVEKPTKTDYDVFCRTMAEEYSFLNVKNIPGATPYAFFKKTLSHSIRNARHYKYKKTLKSSSSERIIKTEKIADNEMQVYEAHQEEIKKALREKNPDNIHIRKLVKATAAHRREKITSLNVNILYVQAMFPALKFQEWILFDFAYESKTTVEDRHKSFWRKLDALKKMKQEEISDDLTYLNLIKWTERKLSPTKNVESCIQMLKVGDNVTSCSDIEAPHLSVYIDEDGSIAAAMVLAEGNIICKLSNLNLFSLFDCLIGVYFTFNYDYPKAYYNFLLFMQTALIKKTVKGQKISSTFVKFLKELEKYEEI